MVDGGAVDVDGDVEDEVLILAAGGAGRTPNEQKIGDSYAACMDVDAINQKGLKPLQPELDRIAARASERGLTLVPTRIYFSGAHAKAEIALARGKDLYDKRQTLRERETKRDMERAVREARR